ncbi:Alkanesulfonate monooxygenase [Corynebacterium provencense]|uniref:Alkanesulfonate monooxygenase n=1 Tax=Corynebacterium provencense TaxID=1737425 RepID=A0A2Z3YMT5_9CORY|nr:LLM class flavin-dependent oxidoreductase [Corynebacterium provencense]AWT24959.1 Alkanesulfonate monooxygenase [Corynebacterium provencense]
MTIDIRARITFDSKQPLADTKAGRAASFFIQKPSNPTVNPEILTNSAKAQEAAGYDSSLIWNFAASPDVWSVAAWALSATSSLRIVAAHRPGVQAPTVAARTLATLDRLSGGRQEVHIIQGRTDADIARDGDFLDHDSRYRRSTEYLDIIRREWAAFDPFDYDGEFYTVRNAQSGVHPVAQPGPRIHAAGNSEAGLDFVSQNADVWAIGGLGLDDVTAQIERGRTAAATHGRTLGYWFGGFNVILADSDEEAWAFTRDIAGHVITFLNKEEQSIADWEQRLGGSVQTGTGATDIQASAFDLDQDEQFRPEGPLYTRFSALTGHGPSLVGTPDSVASYLADYYRAGVEVITLGGIPELFGDDGTELLDVHQKQLRKELIAALRTQAGRIDRERITATGDSQQSPSHLDHSQDPRERGTVA